MTTALPPLPPLPAEDHVCAGCGTDYAALTLDAARQLIAAVPAQARAVALGAADPRRRPAPATWSVLEYACHLRDVYATSTIRLYRVRTEDRPAIEPMLNDLRATRFGYNELDLGAVLTELDHTAAGFLAEVARVPATDWARTATRLPGEERTAQWLVRHAAHEGTHHLADLRDIAGR
ncbi:MAG TPA: DinB family protein [Mycobacteriales bacterium]|nr:DinB family protein [Mycobacteriales bacterium]